MYETPNISMAMVESVIFKDFNRTYTRTITPVWGSSSIEKRAKSQLQKGDTYQISKENSNCLLRQTIDNAVFLKCKCATLMKLLQFFLITSDLGCSVMYKKLLPRSKKEIKTVTFSPLDGRNSAVTLYEIIFVHLFQ